MGQKGLKLFHLCHSQKDPKPKTTTFFFIADLKTYEVLRFWTTL